MDDNDKVQPYSVDIGKKLESAYLECEENGILESGTFEVEVDEKPPRVVQSIEGSKMREFKQIRFTAGGNPEGRAVMRGYNGAILYRCILN